MLLEKQNKLTAILWDSVNEPVSFVKDESKWRKPRNRELAESFLTREKGLSWLGVKDVPTLLKTLDEGWPEGVAKLEKIALRDLASPASVRRRRIRSDQGDEVDMQAVWRGDLSRAWTKTRRQSRTGVRSITIVIDLAAAWNVDADELFWRGASALRLAGELVSAGYNVAIYAAAACSSYTESDSDNRLAQLIEIKGEDSPFDIDRLAALTALPGFFRTHLFNGICFAADNAGETVCDSMGRPSNKTIAEGIKLLPIPQNTFIQKDVLSREAAEQWIESVIQQIEAGNLEAA